MRFLVPLLISFLLFPIFLFSQQHSSGLILDDGDYEDILVADLGSEESKLLPSVSMKTYAPTPQSQGNLNNCVGWASAYCARTIIEAQQQGWLNPEYTAANAFSPGFIYRLINGNQDCSAPVSISHAMSALTKVGAVKVTELQDICPDKIPGYLREEAAKYRIKAFRRLFQINSPATTKINSIRYSLANNLPVIIGMRCPPSFDKADGQIVWNPTESPATKNFFGHAMCVVGYDDKRYGGAFEIQNSWGTDWGKGGYIWVRYDDFAAFVKYAFIMMVDVSETDRLGMSLNAKPTPRSGSPRESAANPDMVDIESNIRLYHTSGEEMPLRLYGNHYKIRRPLPGGTAYNIRIENQKDSYLYVIGMDPNRQIYQVFPKDRDQTALIPAGKEVPIMGDDQVFRMSKSLGEEYLCFLISKKPLNIAHLAEEFSTAPGSIFQRVEQVVGDSKVSPQKVTYFNSSAAISAMSGGNAVGVMIVQLKRR